MGNKFGVKAIKINRAGKNMNHDAVKKLLLVGSWAKEQITVENLRKGRELEIFAYMDTKNPGIAGLVDDYKIGSFYDVGKIVDYAKEKQVDLVLITTASPLSAGTVDELKKEHIPVFGPTKSAARLESDKAFTRQLLKKYYNKATPVFKVFKEYEKAVDFAKSLNWQVAVKPQGLTDGLGVKVFGDQLEDETEVKDYIKETIENKIGGTSNVIVEEKLEGEEFTIQCFVNDYIIIPTPAVQDFKKLLPGEKGLNTASMGSYSNVEKILPFMKQKDYDSAIKIVEETLKAFKKETGDVCCGFLYGQFMLAKEGIKLIEYNFRPGDPEWMNTLIVMKTNILHIIESLLNKNKFTPEFENQATVCKYIVPPKYPMDLNQILKVNFDKGKIKDLGVSFYYSCGEDDKGNLNVGSERGIAFLAKAQSISGASALVEKAISKVKGKFHYRKDIGTDELIKNKTSYIKKLREFKKIRLRTPKEDEFLKVYDFVSTCHPLEKYSEHVYKILLRYFKGTCLIAESEDNVIGWLLGFVSQTNPNKFFVWQIGVDSKIRKAGVGTKLLAKIEDVAKKKGCKEIEITIDPENKTSQRMFEKNGFINTSKNEGEIKEVNGLCCVKDYYNKGRHFMVYSKKF